MSKENEEFYKTTGLYTGSNITRKSEAEEFIDKLSDAYIASIKDYDYDKNFGSLYDVKVSNEYIYVGKGSVGIKCIATNKPPVNSDEYDNGFKITVEKLFLLEFQAMSCDDEFVKLRITSAEDDGVIEMVNYYYYDSEGNEHPFDNSYFDEFLQDFDEPS